MEIIVEWKSFESFNELLVKHKDYWDKSVANHYWHSGVYLHTINHPLYGELVDYVGKVNHPSVMSTL